MSAAERTSQDQVPSPRMHLAHAWCYVAAPLASAGRASYAASRLRARGVRVSSRWHEFVTVGARDPMEPHARRAVLEINLEDMRRAGVLLALTDAAADREAPRATYCEIGWAMAQRLNIVWLQGIDGAGGNIFDAYRGLTVAYDFDAAIDEAVRIAQLRGAA